MTNGSCCISSNPAYSEVVVRVYRKTLCTCEASGISFYFFFMISNMCHLFGDARPFTGKTIDFTGSPECCLALGNKKDPDFAWDAAQQPFLIVHPP